ncbi:hypothetical protein [Candidatus Palauibacter sp.]|uniref:hypothetical protein n=1 Tax=Candidatus Palauibacter sp. TaxID=3101350 RepID=UPI003AF2BFA3
MLIRRYTRNGRDAAVAAAVAKALGPRFEAIDGRFEAIDIRFDAMDAKWEHRFADLRNEMVGLRERFADLSDHVDAHLNLMAEQIAAQIAAISMPVVRGFSEPDQ